MSNLQTYYLKLDFQKVDQHSYSSGKSTAPNAARTISCKAWNSAVEYPIRGCKHDIKEFKGNQSYMRVPLFLIRRSFNELGSFSMNVCCKLCACNIWNRFGIIVRFKTMFATQISYAASVEEPKPIYPGAATGYCSGGGRMTSNSMVDGRGLIQIRHRGLIQIICSKYLYAMRII